MSESRKTNMSDLPESWPSLPLESWKDTSATLHILMYDDVRGAQSPSAALLEFCQSTYEAGAKLANWDRQALEKVPQSSVSAAERVGASSKAL